MPLELVLSLSALEERAESRWDDTQMTVHADSAAFVRLPKATGTFVCTWELLASVIERAARRPN